MAAAVAFGVALLRQTVKALPLKAHTGAIIGQGLMLLGGACVLARLTGGTLAHLASMFGRNVGRKRRLQKQLEVVEVGGAAGAATALSDLCLAFIWLAVCCAVCVQLHLPVLCGCLRAVGLVETQHWQ